MKAEEIEVLIQTGHWIYHDGSGRDGYRNGLVCNLGIIYYDLLYLRMAIDGVGSSIPCDLFSFIFDRLVYRGE